MMSTRYMVRPDKWGETTRYTKIKLQREKKNTHIYEILMRGYIYCEATGSYLLGIQQEKACV